jgi:hypothetical protein
LNIASLDIEWVQSAGATFVGVDAVLDSDGPRRFGDVAGVDELGPDPRFFAGANCLAIRLGAASRGERSHLERATPDANHSPGNGRTHHAFDS